jgi:hypothetical protein
MSLFLVVFLSSLLTQQISWTTKAPLPDSLVGSACAVVNDTVYVIGGHDFYSVHNSNYLYDPVMDSWSTRMNMSTPRGNIGCGVVNGKIYVIGGWIGNDDTGIVEEYDPVSNQWTTKTPMPSPRYAYAIAVVNDKIYVIGGLDWDAQIHRTVEEYDPSADTVGGIPWTTKTDMPTRRFGPGCGVINDTIHVFGGSMAIGGGLTTAHECYDPLSNSWLTKASLLTPRYGLGGFSYGGHVFAIGGFDYYNYRTEVEVYDRVLDVWSYDTPIQYGRQSIAVGLVGNKVYVIGGWDYNALAYNEEGTLRSGLAETDEGNQKSDISLTVSPNPFTTVTRFEILCTSKEDIQSIEIFDVSGRKVKSFLLATGNSQLATRVSWDGRDDNGILLPTGSYILKITIDGKEEKKVLNLLR